ncbi:hypothetical protein BESB_022150 [Besnoitia besnoiti]|uniref:Uncharacterized protein n=1 Tax=Besnoitia besnoiti TaxID=94643 RepID=A0A2A9M4Z7_BESBE|nr:uncharacterized protein BESB_022150 [Besnoitia besnoiti]PFH30723.1 hypothetical protein BESB_022150 [Besnoitia besnoiti]
MVMKSTRELGSETIATYNVDNNDTWPSYDLYVLNACFVTEDMRIFEKPTFVYKLYEYHDIHFGSRLLNVSLYGIHGSDSCWLGTCLVTG